MAFLIVAVLFSEVRAVASFDASAIGQSSFCHSDNAGSPQAAVHSADRDSALTLSRIKKVSTKAQDCSAAAWSALLANQWQLESFSNVSIARNSDHSLVTQHVRLQV